MKYLASTFLFLFSFLSVFGQGLIRYSVTTNGVTANLANNHVLTWDGVAGRWTNAPVVGTAANAIADNLGLGTNTTIYVLTSATNFFGQGTNYFNYAAFPKIAANTFLMLDANSNVFGFASGVLTNLVGTVTRNVTNVVSLSTTNATSKPLTNAYTSGVLTLFGIEQGSGHLITVSSNIIIAADWAQIASTTNVVGVSNWVNSVSNYVTAATNSAQVTNWITTRQPANAVLSNLVGTVAGNVTNVVSLSTTNATSKPLTNSYANGVLTLFGLEGSANITLSQNGSNIVISTAGTAGEVNVNGEVALTNSTMMGLVFDKVGVTNRLRAISARNGLVATNESTNISLAIDPAIVASQSNLTTASNTVLALQVWTNENNYARLLGGSTNSLKVMTNGLHGIAIGDTNRMAYALGWPFVWPFNGSTYMSMLDGSANHDFNQWTHGVLDAITNGAYSYVNTGSGADPYLQENSEVVTNGGVLHLYSLGIAEDGATLYISDGVSDNLVGFQNVGRAGSPLGNQNMMFAKWATETRFALNTNGDITLMGVVYSPPTVQGSAQTILTNDGSGNLGWGAVTGGSGEINVNGEVSVTNATRMGWVYDKQGVTNRIRSIMGGSGILLTNEGTNIMVAFDPAITNVAQITNWIVFRQPADAVLSNLVGTVARNVTNIVSLSTTNATSKPLTNSYTSGVLTLFGIEQGANITLTPNGSNIVIAATGGGSGGTNYPPIIANGGGNQADTNIAVGVGVRQVRTIVTNASFALVLTGTPNNGEEVEVGVSNLSSSTIYWTNTVGIFSPSVASNVTVFAVPGTSAGWWTIKSSTNWNVGSQRWELHNVSGKEFELAVASIGGNGFLAFSTNAAASIVTISNTYIPQASSITLSNLAGTGAITNLISLTLSNTSIKPLVVGVGNAAAATNTTGIIRGIEAGSNVTLSENGSNVVITATGGSGSTNNVVQAFQTGIMSNSMINPWHAGVVASVYATNGDSQFFTLGSHTNLDYVPYSGSDASNHVGVWVQFTQNSTGGFYPTNNGQTLPINTNANRSTMVNYAIINGATNVSPAYPLSMGVATNLGIVEFNIASGTYTNGLTMGTGPVLRSNTPSAFITDLWGTTVTATNTVTTLSLKYSIFTNYVNTVSNFVFAFSTNRYELKNQTNVVFTNIVEEATASGSDMAIHIHNTTGVTMGLVWPAYGAQHGYYFQTNANNPILSTTSLTTGKHGVASFTAFGTNIFATWTEWP